MGRADHVERFKQIEIRRKSSPFYEHDWVHISRDLYWRLRYKRVDFPHLQAMRENEEYETTFLKVRIILDPTKENRRYQKRQLQRYNRKMARRLNGSVS